MPTSKLPVEWVMVPENILQLAATNRFVLPNLRPDQLPEVIAAKKGTEQEFRDLKLRLMLRCDGLFVETKVQEFLKQLKLPADLLMHFQGYGTKRGTAVFRLTGMFWDGWGCPRLDFLHPRGFDKIHGCPNFWGPFILAIAPARDLRESMCVPDPKGERFIDLASRG